MIRRHVKGISMALALLLFGASFAGCGKKDGAGTEKKGKAGESSTQTGVVSYPIQTDVTLKYWMALATNISGYATNFGDTEIGKELTKKTGVKIQYIHPAAGQEKETMNILVASGDLPDIIEYKWTKFPGGPVNAINSSVILKLNDVLDKYSPHFKKYLQENPAFDKEVKTDDGSYYCYPFIRGDKTLLNTSGPIMRKDWLDELGLPAPETLDDWYNTLKAFKEKKGVPIPLSSFGDKTGSNVMLIFENAFGIRTDFYNDNGKVKYGYMEPGYKDMLAFLAKLYKEGLLDKNVASTDRKTVDANMLNGKTAAIYGAGGGNLGSYLTVMKEKDPKFDLTAVKFPAAKKGEVSKTTASDNMVDETQIVITANCKNVDVAARFLDYGYSKEGNLLYNFGTEGVSYNMVNGKPTYSDLVMKNPDKLSVAQAMSNYTRANVSGPFVQDKGYLEQYYELQQQKEAVKIWSDHNKPPFLPIVTPTDEESSESAKLMNDISTYIQEMKYKFIMGVTPIEDYDKYLNQLKKMNIDRVIQLKQNALDRFNKR